MLQRFFNPVTPVTAIEMPMPATKAIAARIPMEDFIKFQKEAIQLKMSMNDFLIMKLYNDTKGEKKTIDEDASEKEFLKSYRLLSTCRNIHDRLSTLHNTISGNNSEQQAYGEPDLESIADGVESMMETLLETIEKEKLYPDRFNPK